MVNTAIEEYALLSDRRSAALVSRGGSVDWLCFPRFDSPSLFGALLDDAAGCWSIRPVAPVSTTRGYLEATMVLETRFRTPDGTVTVTDALATGGDHDPHALGAHAPHLLVRCVTCVDGAVDMDILFRPRPEYGLVVPLLIPVEGGVSARGGPASTALSSPVALTVEDGAARATVRLGAGETLRFALHWAPLDGARPRIHSDAELGDELDRTVRAWRAWSALHQNYQGPWREQVHHSGRVLHALSYQPTGAIVAAPTTSLPETVGGERNWDYRYTWIRDASFTMDALWVAACPDEASEFFAFITTAAATPRAEARLQIMYGVAGEHDLSERQLPHLSGWRGSRPVRVGNGAWSQQQLDVAGELLATAALFADRLDAADPALRAFLPNLADTVARVWRDADHGIWEIRGEPRHFLYSKLMCWAALDRAAGLAERLGVTGRRGQWQAARDEIRATILREGWNDRVGAYTQAFGSDALDASALLLPVVGFLPAGDPRMRATVHAIATRLTDGRGLVYRYRPDSGGDGLPGREGPFLPCTFWLAHVHALAGELDAAREVFVRALAHANDVGLLAEEVDPASDALLGNFPQAFSHIGLVNAAYAIARAESR